MSKKRKKKGINALHTELGHPLEDITQETGKAMDIHLIGMFKPYKACALEKAKSSGVSKIAIPCSIIKGKMLFLYISSPSTAIMGGKKHWLFVVEGSMDSAWSYFKKKISIERCYDKPNSRLKGNEWYYSKVHLLQQCQ